MIHALLLTAAISVVSPQLQGKADAAHVFAYSLLADDSSDYTPNIAPQPIPDAGQPPEVQGRVSDWAESTMRKIVGITLDTAIAKAGMTQEDVGGIGKTVRRFNAAMDAFTDRNIRQVMEAEETKQEQPEVKRPRVQSVIFSAMNCGPCLAEAAEAIPHLKRSGYTVEEVKSLDEALASNAQFVWVTVPEVPKGEQYPKTWTYADGKLICQMQGAKTGQELDDHWQKHYRELFTARK